MHTHTKCTAFSEAFICMLSHSTFKNIIPVTDTAGESCQNNCLSPCCGSEVCAEQELEGSKLKQSQSVLSDLSALCASEHSSDHQEAGLRKAAWPETATECTFLTALQLVDVCLSESCCSIKQFHFFGSQIIQICSFVLMLDICSNICRDVLFLSLTFLLTKTINQYKVFRIRFCCQMFLLLINKAILMVVIALINICWPHLMYSIS